MYVIDYKQIFLTVGYRRGLGCAPGMNVAFAFGGLQRLAVY